MLSTLKQIVESLLRHVENLLILKDNLYNIPLICIPLFYRFSCYDFLALEFGTRDSVSRL